MTTRQNNPRNWSRGLVFSRGQLVHISLSRRMRGITSVRVVHIILVTVLMMVGSATTIESQTSDGALKSNKVISQEAYNRVLDILFPREEPAGNYRLVLRFRPSFHPESQVVVKRGLNKLEVIEYTSLSGNIYSKLNDLVARGSKEDAMELAKLIKVRRRSIEVADSQVRQWHTGFFESFDGSLKAFRKESEQFGKAGTIDVVLDGTF